MNLFWDRTRRRGGLGLATEELLLAKTDQRLQPLDLDLEFGLALQGPGVLGLVVGGLPKRLGRVIRPRQLNRLAHIAPAKSCCGRRITAAVVGGIPQESKNRRAGISRRTQ